MIIDLILDRKDGDNYSQAEFYHGVACYIGGCGGEYASEIISSFNYGENVDVQRSLCDYILEQNYNPEICNYINSVNWK